MSIRPVALRRCLCVGTIFALATVPALRMEAQEDSTAGGEDRVTLHGYFTQGYAQSGKGGPVLGIPAGGTWNYRVLALLTRYQITDDDHLVIQGRYQQRGVSALSDASPQILWAYYQHDFQHLKVSVGRAPLPLGIYNTLREVGTVLPFYRAAPNYYVPGYETVDGVVLTNATPLGAWRLETTVYGGALTNLFQVPTSSGNIAVSQRTERNYGTQLWLETPIQGLRIGAQAISYQGVGAVTPDTTRHTLFGGSIDGTFDRAFVRAEDLWYLIPDGGPNGEDVTEQDPYAEAGVKITERWSLNAQVPLDFARYGGHTVRRTYDRVIGIDFAPTPDIVLKVEGHRTTGAFIEEPVALTDPQHGINYVIVSVSTSF